ncbi:S26 family signal peptidase [Plantactinospora siamensis]|uniref:S26 family signal peptidase n=1 Tax=Plantactinospora siamensis TaxID=555372 RepID=A0ABV6P381_9ACTN
MSVAGWSMVAGGLALAGAAALARRRLVAITVEGRSMEPTLHEGDRVLVLRRPLRRVRRGQIVVLEQPMPGARWARLPRPTHRIGGRDWLVKRAVAVPGDPVPPAVAPVAGDLPDGRVPADSVVVLGDGVSSQDSRMWGLVPGERVLGVSIARLPRRVV